MDNKDTVIISCATLRQELEQCMAQAGVDFPVIWIDSGLHVWPDRLRAALQTELDALDEKYKTCLLLFGFCGNSLVGIKSGGRRLVLPWVSDCISIFLGSEENRRNMGGDKLFFTEGYLHFEHTVFSEHNIYVKRYGEKRAKSITQKMLAHYKGFSVIDTGTYDVDGVVGEIQSLSKEMGLPVGVVKGDLIMISNLLSGHWGDGFLIVEPGAEVTFENSLRVGKSQFQ